MDVYTIVLRVIHIFGGVFWVGSAVLLFFFIGPTAEKSIPEGPRFINKLMSQGRLAIWIPIAATATVLSGILLYIKESNGFQLNWITSSAGIQFTAGGIAGIGAFLIGAFFIAPTTNRLILLGEEIEKNGKPSLKQKKELLRLQSIMSKASTADLILLVIVLALMIIAPEFTN